jgi:hypothetical protein
MHRRNWPSLLSRLPAPSGPGHPASSKRNCSVIADCDR